MTRARGQPATEANEQDNRGEEKPAHGRQHTGPDEEHRGTEKGLRSRKLGFPSPQAVRHHPSDAARPDERDHEQGAKAQKPGQFRAGDGYGAHDDQHESGRYSHQQTAHKGLPGGRRASFRGDL